MDFVNSMGLSAEVRVELNHPTCDAGIIIPPLPEKNAIQKYQMTSEFIEQRRQALQVYINRVVSNRFLSRGGW